MNSSDASDLTFQQRILPGVSRTFAVTIPQLSGRLRTAVANAYLLCRIADTVEDDPKLAPEQKSGLLRRFAKAVKGEQCMQSFAGDAGELLDQSTAQKEAELVRSAQRVVNITYGLAPGERQPIEKCIEMMCRGMPEFQRSPRPQGLRSMADLEDYCYVVAGTVGEMLTELFCAASSKVAARRDQLLQYGLSFGQGLQMTNILKDVWEDREGGRCWLPRDKFGDDVGELEPGSEEFRQGISELVAVAHGHLVNASRYVQLIPAQDAGIRKFCLTALVLALLTLRRIEGNLTYSVGAQVKISRRAVKWSVIGVRALGRSNFVLRTVFRALTRNLPQYAEPPNLRPVAARCNQRFLEVSEC